MQTVDFSRVLESSAKGIVVPSGVAPVRNLYDNDDGVQFRSLGGTGELVQEVVRLSDYAFLFASDHAPAGAQMHRQIVADSDWVHIQFRLNGGGREDIVRTNTLETPEKSCVVARYPKGSIVERRLEANDRWRFVCLLFSPRGLTTLLDAPASVVPERRSWLASDDERGHESAVLPLLPGMALAAQDILSCSFRGANRRTYMRAKSLELLSTVLHALEDPAPLEHDELRFSNGDLARLARAREIMMEDLENTLTLAELARHVGLNRTKLAVGFKQVHGMSVQAFWRDAKLCHARELLRERGVRVTDVAFSLGYAELSSFTRAFSRKFGMLPRDCRGNLH